MKSQVVMAQLTSVRDKNENLVKAENAIKQAKELYNSDLVVFPEAFMSYFEVGAPAVDKLNDAETIEGPFVKKMAEISKEYGVWTIFGMREANDDDEDERVYNTTVVIDSNGSVIDAYRKTHLYDAFGAQESATIKPSKELFKPIDTPFGRIGLFVCYELRFPEIARHQALQGAEIIIVPTAWVTGPLKELHWETLVRARAIENNVFMVGCGHVGDRYIGQSLVVDPMGVTLAQGTEKEHLIPCTIDTQRVHDVRTKLPSHEHRIPELYS